MKKFVILIVAVLLLAAGSIASAMDVNPPIWRGQPATTMQQWEFSVFDFTPAPDIVHNPYGTTLLWANTHGWIDEMDGYQGIWPLSGELDVYIPNAPLAPQKQIWIQLVWKPEDQINPFLPDEPMVAVTPFDEMMVVRTDTTLNDGWTYSLFVIDIWPNPIEEWITIKGNIYVDELVIDTICPEPATVALLGLGGLALLRRKR